MPKGSLDLVSLDSTNTLVDVVFVNAHFRVDGEEYLVLTRQWREATGAYSVAFPAGTYEKGDGDAIKAGIRELKEETPFTAIKGDLSIPAFSSDGCLSETFQILEVRAEPKPGTTTMNGIALGATTQTSGESIVTLYVPLNTLYRTLSMLEKSHHSIDGRLMVYALGYENARRDARRRFQNTFQAIFTAFAFGLVLYCLFGYF